jgi:hypothetical protein
LPLPEVGPELAPETVPIGEAILGVLAEIAAAIGISVGALILIIAAIIIAIILIILYFVSKSKTGEGEEEKDKEKEKKKDKTKEEENEEEDKEKEKDKKKQGCLSPIPVCPHLGGNAQHNLCADIAPPNIYPGCDVGFDSPLGSKKFDALSPANTLWEVKTEAYSTYSDFLKRITISLTVAEATFELAVAVSCGYGFVLGVTDPEYMTDLLATAPLPVVLIEC